MEYGKLQNGSDIRGVAMPGVEGEEVNLDRAAVEHIAGGFIRWLRGKVGGDGPLRVSLGRDSRLSGEEIAGWMARAMAERGALVTDMGLATTPAMFMTTVTEGFTFDGAVMVTASHLPWNRNGLKFFTAAGGAASADIKDILAGPGPGAAPAPGKVERGTFMEVYAALLRDKVRAAAGKERPLEGCRIVVDAGNGAGGFYAADVLAPLGADVTGSVYLEPDGRFPNHVPNPEDAAAMDSIRSAVLENKADLGIIFDTDVDRAGAVLRSGEELNRNRLIALISAIVLREHPGTTIVTDSVTSTGLAEFIARRGGVHRRFRRGYRNVINEGLRLNALGQDCQLAIETSGHAAMKENWFLDDGAYLVTRFVIEMACGRPLESLVADLAEPVESREFRMRITDPDFKAAGEAVLAALERYAAAQPGWSIAPDNFEGVRVNLDKSHGRGWFLLRLSLHDPILPLNVESDEAGGLRRIARELAPFMAEQKGVDVSALLECAM